MIILLGVSLGSVLAIGLLSWERSRSNLKQVISDRLTTVRVIKGNQLEDYFQTLRDHIETLCEDRTIVSAMAEFSRAYDTLNNQYAPLSDDRNKAIEDYYNKKFFPELSKTTSGDLNFESYAPKSQAAKYLQYHYIVKNPNPVGKKDKLNDAGDGSDYSKIHTKYHDLLHHLSEKFGYRDLFLIDPNTGDAIYTVSKQTDFTTNLNEGPYRESNLAQLVAAVRKHPERRTIQIIDFQAYAPSNGEPVGFIAGPIYNGPYIIGILAVQLPIDHINKIMVGDPALKLKSKTTETYLIGSDLLMRSNSRFVADQPERYKQSLLANDTPESTVKLIEQWGSSVLLQKVDTEAAKQAINGKEGTISTQGYLGKEVLSSYAPLHIQGLNWAILNEKELDEAFQPVAELQTFMLIVAVILIALVTWGASAAASIFLKPVNKLNESLSRLNRGDLNATVERDSDDEFGDMAGNFNDMVDKVRQQADLIAQKDRQNEALLLNIMPAPVVERVKKGEQQIVDNVKLAAVLVAHVRGITELSQSGDAQEIVALLNKLVDAFDDATNKHEVEKIKTIGDSYIVTCGVIKPRLDYTQTIMHFALEMFGILQRFNNEHRTDLSLSIGIDDGAIMAGLVGTKKFSYDIWGETFNVANFLQMNTQPNTIAVTQAVYERLHDLYHFEQGTNLLFPETNKTLATWVFKRSITSLADRSPSQRLDSNTGTSVDDGRVQAEV